MNTKKKGLLFVTTLLVFGGCATTPPPMDNSKDKKYYINKAKTEIEKYRVTEHNEFYGYALGEKFTGRNDFSFSADEETGGRIYRHLEDTKGIFDGIAICTDHEGTILKIILAKTFNNKMAGMSFYHTIVEKLEATYPAMYEAGREDLHYTIIYVADNDDEWIEKYCQHLEYKEEGWSIHNDFPYMLHPTLAEISCTVNTIKGETAMALVYTGKEYIRMTELHKKKLKQKLGEL